ncbi:DUF1707 domain-containing protein [Thalassotalea ganghwensis]
MPVVIEDRPLEKVREEVIDQLIFNYSHGKLSYEAFERRLDAAMASKSNLELAKLAEDLEEVTDSQYVESKRRDFAPQYTTEQIDDVDYLVNVFGGSNRSGRWTAAREIRSVSIFGGADIDFTDAQFGEKKITLKVLCIFGGNNIYVPENVNVVSKAFCIFGGVDDKAATIADSNAPTIVIEGLVVFGGIDIKLKRTVKERFVAFADSLKKMIQ